MADWALRKRNDITTWNLVSGWTDIGGGNFEIENGAIGVAEITLDLTTTSGTGGLAGDEDGFYLDTDVMVPVTSEGGLPAGFQMLSFGDSFSTTDFAPGGDFPTVTYEVTALGIPSTSVDQSSSTGPYTFPTPPNNADLFTPVTISVTFTSANPGSVTYAPSPAGDSVFTAGGTYDLSGGTSVFPNTDDPNGFYKSDIPGIPQNVDAELLTGITARPAAPRGIVISGPWGDDNPLWGHPGHAVVYKNRLIYAAGNYTVGTDLPTIRAWNGTSDYELCKVPGVAATPSNCVVTMAMGDGLVYLTTWDSGTTSADVIGRVLRLNPDSGQLTNVGDINSLSGHVPYALMFHNGELWTATHRSSAADKGAIARIKPETQTAWTIDLNLAATSQSAVLSMASYKGNFYYGAMAPAGTFAVVGQRTPSAVYSVSLTATGGAAQNFNGFYAMCVFADSLYASYWNPDASPVSKIYKFDGSSWSTVYTGAGDTAIPYVALFADNGTLYAVGAQKDGSDFLGALLTTPDGTTWTDRTAKLVLTDGVVTLTERMPTNAYGSISY